MGEPFEIRVVFGNDIEQLPLDGLQGVLGEISGNTVKTNCDFHLINPVDRQYSSPHTMEIYPLPGNDKCRTHRYQTMVFDNYCQMEDAPEGEIRKSLLT